MTLVKNIEKEIARINKNPSTRYRVSRAREQISCAYLALELGLKEKANLYLTKANSYYRIRLINACDEGEFTSFEQEKENANCFIREIQEGIKYANPLKTKQDREPMSDFLEILRTNISPDLYKSIRAQKQYAQILLEPELFYPDKVSNEIDNLLERLDFHKIQTGQLPEMDFQYISEGIDQTYNHVLESSSIGDPERCLVDCVFEKRFNRMKNIIEADPSKKLVARWIDEKLKQQQLKDASTILRVTGVSGKDSILTPSFETYFPEVKRTVRINMVSVSDVTHEWMSNKKYRSFASGGIGRYSGWSVRLDNQHLTGCKCSSQEFSKACKEFKSYLSRGKVTSNSQYIKRSIKNCKVKLERYTNGFGVIIKTKDLDKIEEVRNEFLDRIWPK